MAWSERARPCWHGAANAINNASDRMTEPPLNPAVAIEGLIKQFGRFAALRGVTGAFAPGQLYVIVGDNGAGKTTLLRAMAGLAEPTRGTISVLGTRDIKQVRARIGYMSHASLVYDEMSALENLRYFGSLYEIEERRPYEVLDAVKLDSKLERPVGQYSQGMRQRLSLARAMLNDPELLLLDEPFSNVDLRSTDDMIALLAESRRRGRTIFVVTHQPGLLESIADEYLAMSGGQIARRTSRLPEPRR